ARVRPPDPVRVKKTRQAPQRRPAPSALPLRVARRSAAHSSHTGPRAASDREKSLDHQSTRCPPYTSPTASPATREPSPHHTPRTAQPRRGPTATTTSFGLAPTPCIPPLKRTQKTMAS